MRQTASSPLGSYTTIEASNLLSASKFRNGAVVELKMKMERIITDILSSTDVTTTINVVNEHALVGLTANYALLVKENNKWVMYVVCCDMNTYRISEPISIKGEGKSRVCKLYLDDGGDRALLEDLDVSVNHNSLKIKYMVLFDYIDLLSSGVLTATSRGCNVYSDDFSYVEDLIIESI